MEKYVHQSDCEIERDHADYPASAALLDFEGEVVYRFDEDWSDDQIWMALAFANKLYDAGVKIGKEDKAREIKRALGIVETTS